MAGGRHIAGRASRIALRDFVYRPRKARIELAAYSAHVNLPYYFGSYEWSIPIQSIAVVDLTVPGTPRTQKELKGEFLGRTVTYLFTTARARTATTLLLFAEPQRVPPLRIGPALDPGVRPFLPFGYVSSRRRRGAWVDGLLLRVDRPREAVDRLVAAGALRGVYRDGRWRVERGDAATRAAIDPPWARRSVDRFDGAARALLVSGTVAGWNMPTIARVLGYDVPFWSWTLYLDDDIPLWAWAAAWGMVAAGFLCRLIARLLYRRAPADLPPPGRLAPPGTGPGSVRPPPSAPGPPDPYAPNARRPGRPPPGPAGPWSPRAPVPSVPGPRPAGGRGPYRAVPSAPGPRPGGVPGPHRAAPPVPGDRPGGASGAYRAAPPVPGGGPGGVPGAHAGSAWVPGDRPGRGPGAYRAAPMTPGKGSAGQPARGGPRSPAQGTPRAGPYVSAVPARTSPPAPSKAGRSSPSDPATVRPRWAVPAAASEPQGPEDTDDPGPRAVRRAAMANRPTVGTVVAGRRPARPDPRGADRGR